MDSSTSAGNTTYHPIIISDIVRIIFERKISIIVATLLVTAGVAFAVFWLIVSTYEVKARLHVDLASGAIPIVRSSSAYYISDTEKLAFFETVIQELKNIVIMEKVVDELDLGEKRRIGNIERIKLWYMDLKRWIGHKCNIKGWQKEHDPRGASIKAVYNNFNVNRLENSTILELVYEAKDPVECKETLDEIITQFISYRNDFVSAKAFGSSKFLLTEIERVKTEITQAEKEWLKLMNNDTFQLNQDLFNSKRQGSSENTPNILKGVATNDHIMSEMRLYVIKMHEELSRVIAKSSESHPSVKPLRENIKAYTDVINLSPQKQVMLNRIQREIAAKEKIYNELLTTYQNTVTMESAELGRLDTVKLVQPTTLPSGHKKPKRSLALLAGMFLGLLMGISYAFIAHAFDSTIRRPEDFSTKLNLKYLASIPKL